MNYKRELTEAMCALLKQQEQVLAIWEGGSAATGFEDEYSDLDFCIVTKRKAGDEIFSKLDEFFAAQHGIARRFRIPEPAWHGMSQCMYLLSDSPELFYCDICVVERDNPHKLTEQDRHGSARILYDPQGILKPITSSQEELDAICRRVWRMAASLDFVFEIELKKAIKRGLTIDAISLYHTFLQRCLVSLLNLKYRPHKADFGLRYIHREYPAEAVTRVEDLLSIKDGLPKNVEMMLALYHDTKKELEAIYAE
ncbi:MAG: nucleotidyltransferase domain-containing protein [Candidatus Cloacimonetes bacterium]|nr:nucleotidyltransferase domain-containing protein [Candidatus Cloacimonadota bacterium]